MDEDVRSGRALPLSQEALPLYERVMRQIADEFLAPPASGKLLPAERELAQRLGVSRVTLRRALAQLEADGLVASSPGRGWYPTSDRLAEPPNTLLSFTELGLQGRFEASSRVLVAETRTATLDEAGSLEIAPGADLFHLQRVRFLDNIPIAVDESRIPLALAPGIASYDFSTVSLYSVLEHHCGLRIARADYAVEAMPADRQLAERLGLEPGGPILRAQQTTYDDTGRTIELATTWYRFDRYRFRASLTRIARS
jgi:GntR family transcriptional regulator